jgi:hypothetical protein
LIPFFYKKTGNISMSFFPVSSSNPFTDTLHLRPAPFHYSKPFSFFSESA